MLFMQRYLSLLVIRYKYDKDMRQRRGLPRLFEKNSLI